MTVVRVAVVILEYFFCIFGGGICDAGSGSDVNRGGSVFLLLLPPPLPLSLPLHPPQLPKIITTVTKIFSTLHTHN